MLSRPGLPLLLTPGLGPSTFDSAVCRSCQETIVRRNYSSAAASTTADNASAPPPSSSTSSHPNPASIHPVLKPTYTVKAGVVLSRPPQITRDLTPFEKAYYFYQKRLNERLALPFTRYFYFKRGTPADEDWKRKYRERQTPARDIGKYNAYSKEAWNDELLVGAVESEPEHQIEMLVRDAETSASGSQEGGATKKEEVQRPFPRVTEADKKGDQKSLNRALQRTLYLLVQSKEGYWKFPSTPVEAGEDLRGVSILLFIRRLCGAGFQLPFIHFMGRCTDQLFLRLGRRANPRPIRRCQHEHLDGRIPPHWPLRLQSPETPDRREGQDRAAGREDLLHEGPHHGRTGRPERQHAGSQGLQVAGQGGDREICDPTVLQLHQEHAGRSVKKNFEPGNEVEVFFV